jgi:hypothetical protein
MADDLKQTGRPDDQRINVGVSRDRLREAAAKAGPVVKNVQRELRGP